MSLPTGACYRGAYACLALCCAAIALQLHATGAANTNATDIEDMLQFCQQFDDLYQAIDDDLAPWKAGGIDRALMAQSITKFSSRGGNKGIALAFLNGTAYVVDANLSGPVGHHAGAYFAYMQVMLELQHLFGKLIPDVEFVLTTSDRPMVLLSSPKPHLPVFRFCSSDAHADIQVPIFHFSTKKYMQSSLQIIPEINKTYPWEKKKEILFGRFSQFVRIIDPSVPLLQRSGAGNSVICKLETPGTAACTVRHHMNNWSKNFPGLMDIKSSPRLPMPKHAQYKYLLHLDGQALSSRIDMLLPLNSLVFKEESGYTTFYHHLLKPMVHYIPVWKKTPDDIPIALKWAKDNDAEARRIASNAQQFAIKYLNKRTRMCYWFRLLVEFSKLLRYKVSAEHEVREDEEKQRATRRKKQRPTSSPPPWPPSSRESSGTVKQVAGNTTQGTDRQGNQARENNVPQLPQGLFGTLGQWKSVEEYLGTIPGNFEGGRWFSNKTEQF